MDLNILIENDGQRDSKEVIFNKIRTALNLGFKTIALSVRMNENQITNPPKPPKIELKESANFKLLTRVTVVLEDSSKIHKITKSDVLKEYDLFAVEPVNDKIISQLCGGHLECDIVSFSLQQRLPFNVKKLNFTVPQTKGTCFEVNYRQLLMDSISRQNVIAASQTVIARLKGKNVLLSSGAQTAIELRGPYDITNLALLLDLPENKAKQAVFTNGNKAIRLSELRKNITSRAVIIKTQLEENDKWLLNELESDDEKKNISAEEVNISDDITEPSAKKIKSEFVS